MPRLPGVTRSRHGAARDKSYCAGRQPQAPCEPGRAGGQSSPRRVGARLEVPFQAVDGCVRSGPCGGVGFTQGLSGLKGAFEFPKLSSEMPSHRSPEDEAAIRLARLTQTRAIAAGDLDTVVRYWTDDITIRRGLGHAVDGIAAAREMLDAGNGAGKLVYQREAVTVEVSTCWPLAYEEGRWAGYAGDVSAAPVVTGRYAAQWIKRDAGWLIRSEVFVALDATDDGRAASAP